MNIPNFTIFAVLCVSIVHFMSFSAVIMQEAEGDVYTMNVNNNRGLPHQASTFEEVIVMPDQFKHNKHNFDVNLRQIDVKNLEKFGVSFFNIVDSCKNYKVVQASLARCYEQMVFEYESEWATLQNAVSFYNTRNFESDFSSASVQKVALGVQIENPVFLDEKSQKPVRLHATESKQGIETEFLSASPVELADVFTHDMSGIHDVFTEESSYSSGRQQE